ncbi:hypothetical protein V6N11_033703 [Hibiscus sabdariffa]|uniref:Uncharacterized protein n=1 Tax=Hibiscus sabdariffa TaxID=183260 RepID=A0ABR2S0B0_9ROSI
MAMSLAGDGSAKRSGRMVMTLAGGALLSLQMWVVALVLPPNMVGHGSWCGRCLQYLPLSSQAALSPYELIRDE